MSFIETHTGRDFWPLTPASEDVDIEDIAHHLSNQCRFAGATKRHYSVAEHSLRVCDLLREWGCPTEVQLWGLLHDAAEAYLLDLPTPLKRAPRFAAFEEAEERLMLAICTRFELPFEKPVIVRAADGVLLATEVRDLMPNKPEHWSKLEYAPHGTRIPDLVPFNPEHVRSVFLKRFFELFNKRETLPAPAPVMETT